MEHGSDEDQVAPKHSPLVPLGLIVLGVMLVPVLIYSMTPEGPVKEGDVVFSTGRHRVSFAEPHGFEEIGYEGYCVVEPREQLVIVRTPRGEARRTLVARAVGRSKIEVPFCPPRAEFLVQPHEVSLRIDLWEELRDTLAHLLPAP